jgi:hypothetical protein
LTIARSNHLLDELELLVNENKALKAALAVEREGTDAGQHVDELKRMLADRNERASNAEVKCGLLQAQVAKLDEEKQALQLKIYAQEESLNVIFE